MSGPRLYDGRQWNPVVDNNNASEDGGSSPRPIAPVEDGDGTIFVSIASYRDGERCGKTLKALFENAADPDKIIVGLVEQNEPEDKFCLEVYCAAFGARNIKRDKIRSDMTKIVVQPDGRKACPRFDQVRLVAYHHIQAKGPVFSRSLARKVLGNEEFCMQIDAHSDFVKDWDKVAREEWHKTQNEFGVISHVPARLADKAAYQAGGAQVNEVPRQCMLRFLDNGFPDYFSPVHPDGKSDGKVVDLQRPLLGHGWSAAFSFAKCHLEETVPYDIFSVWAMPVEQFSRFARMWTRGYDVYTPTRTIVFHDYDVQANGHGDNEWFKRQSDRFRKASIDRARGLLESPGSVYTPKDLANLGIYGLGQRRSLEQLESFARIDVKKKQGNFGLNVQCVGHQWTPYDAAIAPTANRYNDPDNLAPQPEYPLRTEMLYYEQVSESFAQTVASDESASATGAMAQNQRGLQLPDGSTPTTLLRQHGPDGFDVATQSNMPPIGTLVMFWLFGLVVWYLMFMTPGASSSKARSSSVVRPRKKASSLGAKEV